MDAVSYLLCDDVFLNLITMLNRYVITGKPLVSALLIESIIGAC